jgi:hypothetical protein
MEPGAGQTRSGRTGLRTTAGWAALLLSALASVVISACGSTAAGRVTAPRASRLARWTEFARVRRPLDLAGPRANGSLVLAADARLSSLAPGSGLLAPYRGGYHSPGGEEPYVAVSPGGCYGNGVVYALRLTAGRSVTAIGPDGATHRLATLRLRGLLDGVTFDHTGRFRGRLLVTSNASSRTSVVAIDCHGAVTTITHQAPRLEGGIAVAPASFGRFAGDLIAPGETSGKVFAVTARGHSELVVNSHLPHGNDIGVESEGFVPHDPHAAAFLADRFTPGNPHPGDDVVLRLTAGALRAAGVRPGDLLVSTEGGALTDAIRCSRSSCQTRLVAQGPAIAHGEGHIAFARP